MQSEGLGDDIAKITKATKIDELSKKIANIFGHDDCGCDDRRKKLNKLFPYKNQHTPEEMQKISAELEEKERRHFSALKSPAPEGALTLPKCGKCEAEKKAKEAGSGS
jgi:hypothetical protein